MLLLSSPLLVLLCGWLLLLSSVTAGLPLSSIHRALGERMFDGHVPPSRSPSSTPRSSPALVDRWAERMALAAPPVSVDCPLKRFAAEFASYLQPQTWPHSSNWTEEVVAAMGLPSLCNATADDVRPPPFRRPSTLPLSAAASPACDWTRHVDGVRGNNDGPGSLDAPWKSIDYALGQSRLRAHSSVRACVWLKAGAPYYLGQHRQAMGSSSFESQTGALALTSLDSNLTLSAYLGEQVTLSAGVRLDLQWSTYRTTRAGTIMQAKLPAGLALDWDHFNELYVEDGRAIRAKFPNGDPFHTSKLTSPTGYVSGAASWIGPDPHIPAATEIHVSEPEPESKYFPQFQIALEGTVRSFDPPRSYWGLAHPPGGGGSTYVIPRGFRWRDTFSPRAANWSRPSTGRIFTYHGRGWGSWQFAIDRVDASNSTVWFGAGGWQEARGAASGGLMYVHNIFEELDDPKEWFVDEPSRTLYFMSNGTMPHTFVASQSPCIVSAQGSRQSPVVSVTLAGITFTHTPNHFLRRYEAPSGGDYAIHRGGAVVLHGTEQVTIINCTFEHLGGNALVVSDYNVNATVAYSQFQWLGESAIILVGSSHGVDGVSCRDQPTNTHIEGNLMRDFSVYVKQGDAIFESVVRNSVWAGNMAYNSPRSLFNKNDGFAGGLNAYQNLLFNANKETSDHGQHICPTPRTRGAPARAHLTTLSLLACVCPPLSLSHGVCE